MTCNICGVHEATIHLTEIVNNQMIEVHMCEACAQEKGTDFKTHFNFVDLLAGISDFEKLSKGKEPSVLKCPNCGLTYDEFTKHGRLGCPVCYQSMSKTLLPLIKRVQRSVHHIGKKPAKLPRNVQQAHGLQVLQEKLRQCIQSEEFEKAAQLRDEIKQQQEKGKKRTRKNDG